MFAVYSVCALVGGTVLVLQFVLTIAGFGDVDDVDFDTDIPDDVPDFDHAHDGADGSHHDSTWFFGIISLRTVVAALAFFGIVGLAGKQAGAPELFVLVLAAAAGFGAMLLVHWLMTVMKRLRADGTVRIQRTVGRPAKVYLRVPAGRQGAGKVTVDLVGRTHDYSAVTPAEELPTGASVVVTGVVGPDTVEVAAAPRNGE